MLIFCSFCCLPSQSQRSDSLLKLCLEALFGAQSRVALPRRVCFQALLSGCTILPIISCSSFARSKYLQMAVNMDGPRCAQGGMLVLYLFGISKNPRHFSPSPQGRRLVHHLHSGMSRRHQVGYIIFMYPPPLVVPHPLSFLGGGGGGRHLVNPKFFVAAHCVVVWVTVLWGTAACILCTHGRTFCSLSLNWVPMLGESARPHTAQLWHLAWLCNCVCCIQGNTFLYVFRRMLCVSEFQVVPAPL